jgi:ABC-type multidrug transport system fused ATPase/permease subunit
VTSRYRPGDLTALRDVTSQIAAGFVVAIVGTSGSGKTTLTSLAIRFWHPDAGRILLGGIGIRDMPPASVRSRISVVSQHTHLFNASIRDSALLGNPDASQQEVETACRRAAIHDFIMGLPEGYATTAGETGLRLSRGLRQRIAIARALPSDTPLLILDEATSELDPATEAAVQGGLTEMKGGRTTLVISHRLSAVINADLIVVIDHGRVAEQETHGSLVSGGGPCARLLA